MKKLLSVLVAVAFAMSVVGFAFAADNVAPAKKDAAVEKKAEKKADEKKPEAAAPAATPAAPPVKK